ncbi:MAG: glycoside hydrolase family 57 protein [Candidatus Omnitrophota bacterium]
MLYLAFIFHMHQPYYQNLLTHETPMPWVRLHGTKDYLDMVKILEDYPLIHQTFNLVPSLIEQIEDYSNGVVKDKFLELSYKNAGELTVQEQNFIRENFFMINKERVIMIHPRYFELYNKRQADGEFNTQDYLDLQVWFNLSWIDPYFIKTIPELKKAVMKARFFTEEEKRALLDKQTGILKDIVPGYKKSMESGQIEITISPYYHPILPLLCDTRIAREANHKALLPKTNFKYPGDCKAQIEEAVEFYRQRFGGLAPQGMWPSEEGVSEHIIPFIIQSGIKWIVTDEVILFRSLKKKVRDPRLLYQPHLLKRKDGELNIIFRDRVLSDLIGFVYYNWKTQDAVNDLMMHLENIADAFKREDVLAVIAMDGENAWEYYPGDGHDFLGSLYARLSESKTVKTVTVSEYLKERPAKRQIKHLSAGSWIYGEFGKWIGSHYKNKAWECLAKARKELDDATGLNDEIIKKAFKQIHIAEGSDWFWWYGDDHGYFDGLFRMHLSNFYKIIDKDIPEYLNDPL